MSGNSLFRFEQVPRACALRARYLKELGGLQRAARETRDVNRALEVIDEVDAHANRGATGLGMPVAAAV